MKNSFNILTYIIMTLLIINTVSCKEEDNLELIITTNEVIDINTSTSTCGGNITSDGGSVITSRGVCWGTGTTPTIADSKTSDGTGAGSFLSLLTGLTPSTKYFVRAYATNSNGTQYGLAMSFTTNDIQFPSLTTVPVTNISSTSAVCGGEISSDGGEKVATHGICWGISNNPTIEDQLTSDGSYSSNFSCNFTGLTANTTYYVRAYATNSAGTGYGNEVSFTTQQETGETVTDIDGNVYHTVTIGTQVWMLENLKTSKYRDGTIIPNETDNFTWLNLTTGACCDYENEPSNSVVYGKLYNYYAIADTRNICPLGWHVPTMDEWTTLITFLGGVDSAGDKLRESGTTHWENPNAGATNESGFTALPGGWRQGYGADGKFYYLNRRGYWFGSTFMSGTGVSMHFNYSFVATNYDFMSWGYSVRCIKD
jgi:uncharacterized protein (TIGR02145 family)